MRLQDLRLKEGMSLEQLAELSGVDHDRLVMFENNPETIRNMHLDTARQIAKALHCNVLELHPDEGWRGGIHCAESGLRDIRRTRGYTQNELSEMTGIPQPNISWFETGYRSTSGMRLDTARRLSEALRCDPTDFLKEAYSRYENKCCIWFLITDKGNPRACHVYEKLGGKNDYKDEIVYVYDYEKGDK